MKYFLVEYDIQYVGGNYNKVGEFVYVPLSLLDGQGTDDMQVEKAFEQHTGISAIHIVNYNLDEEYANQIPKHLN